MADLTSDEIWGEIDRRSFAVVSFVNSRGEPRSAGVVYVTDGRRLFVATDTASWKARHIRAHPHVAVTIPIAKRIPFLPWIQIPAATISFHGVATVASVDDTDPDLAHRLLRGLEDDPARRAETSVVTIAPEGSFTTYGVGVTTLEMRDRTKARGHAAVA